MNMSTKQQRIAKLARQYPMRSFTSLNHYITFEWLYSAYKQTRKTGALGVDGQSAKDYALNLKDNLYSLLGRIKSGRYYAPAIRRTHIPKGDGKTRPLGIPTFEDKIAQRAIVMLLEPIYEADFHDFSYGFRKQKSAHQALQSLRNNIMDEKGRWILDLDIQKYFDTIDHQKLRKFLDQRITDGVIRKMIDKWLKAGILEFGRLSYPTQGTPQGGVVSPLLANIYLHYVLDQWFKAEVEPRMQGKCNLVRFADDCVMVFENYQDCYRVQRVLDKRFERFGLKLHPEKTKRVDFRFRYRRQNQLRGKPVNFDFLGFTHYWGKSRRGHFVVRQKTEKSRLARAIKSITEFCRSYRHKPIPEQQAKLNQKLRGHYAYFGITGNSKSLGNLHYKAERIWHKWLGRRSRKSYITWSKFVLFLKRFPLEKPRIYHKYYKP